MKILFIISEGQHDAQFLSRLLVSSKTFTDPKWQIQEYPEPLASFFKKNFQRHDIESIIIGDPKPLMIPHVSLKSIKGDLLILVYILGGHSKIEYAHDILNNFFAFIPQKDEGLSLYEEQGGKNEYALLFFFDADQAGRNEVLAKFKLDFNGVFNGLNDLDVEKWTKKRGIPLGLFIFTGNDGETGTLEDTLVQLFRRKNSILVDKSYELINSHSNHEDSTVAQKAKKAKSALTICGQVEKDRAGAALAVIVKHCNFLCDAFDFIDTNNLWCRILKMIESAFENKVD